MVSLGDNEHFFELFLHHNKQDNVSKETVSESDSSWKATGLKQCYQSFIPNLKKKN